VVVSIVTCNKNDIIDGHPKHAYAMNIEAKSCAKGRIEQAHGGRLRCRNTHRRQ